VQQIVQSSNHALVKEIPSEELDTKLEVVVEQQCGEHRVMLRSSTWTDGLGWCPQKTISLDASQLDDLHHAITVARHRLNRQRSEENESPREPARVIQLPSLAV
jgi:hypothetical protein